MRRWVIQEETSGGRNTMGARGSNEVEWRGMSGGGKRLSSVRWDSDIEPVIDQSQKDKEE